MLLNLLAHKIPFTRKYINGTPTILMNEGSIYRKNLKKAKLDLSEFMLLCRECGYLELDDIQSATFEHNGKLSILPKSASRPVTVQDLGLCVKVAELGIEVIVDGRILGENLHRMNKSEKWLEKELKKRGFTPKQILLGIYHKNEDRLSLYPNS